VTGGMRLLASGLSLVTAGLSGPGLLAAALPPHPLAGVRRGLIIFLGPCIGLSLWGAVGVAAFFMHRATLPALMIGDALLAAMAAVGILLCRKARPPVEALLPPPAPSEHLSNPMLCVLLLATAGSAAVFLLHARLRPDGLWDAWSIWNLRARFIYFGSTHAFDAGFPHADYPPLYPTLIARIDWLVGAASTTVPLVCGAAAAALCAGTLFFGVAWLRGPRTGALAAIVLLGTQEFMNHAADQYADVPLACLFLGASVLVAIFLDGSEPRRIPVAALAGVLAGAATLLKNEGAFHFLGLFAGMIAAVAIAARPRKWGGVAAFIAGALPMLLLLGIFKIAIAPPSDMITGREAFAIAEDADSSPTESAMEKNAVQRDAGSVAPPSLWKRLSDLRRYWAILLAVLNRLIRIDRWNLFLAACVASFFFRPRTNQGRASRRALAIALLVTSAGYFAAYLATPHNLTWHINTSINRLILQMWGVMLLLASLRLVQKPGQNKPPGPV